MALFLCLIIPSGRSYFQYDIKKPAKAGFLDSKTRSNLNVLRTVDDDVLYVDQLSYAQLDVHHESIDHADVK